MLRTATKSGCIPELGKQLKLPGVVSRRRPTLQTQRPQWDEQLRTAPPTAPRYLSISWT